MKKRGSDRITIALDPESGGYASSRTTGSVLRRRIEMAFARILRVRESQAGLPVAIAAWIVAAIVIIVFLKWADGLLVPLLLGIMLAYTLAPFVNWLETCRIHRTAGAMLVLGILLGGAGWIGVALSGEVQAIANQLPDVARKLGVKIRQANANKSNVFRKVQDAASELDKVARETTASKGAASAPAPASAPVDPVSSTLKSWFGANISLLMQGTAQALVVVLLAYSLLAAGPLFRRKLMSVVGPNLSDKKEVLRTLTEIQQQMQSYFLWLVATNALIGLAIWGVFFALGVDNPGFWGVVAALLHFIPYVGTLVLASASGLASFLQTGTYIDALTTATVAVAVNGAIGVGVLTWMQARLYRVSATALFLSLLFFGWLWGAWGVLLAAPLVGVMKVICDRTPSMERFAVFLAP